MASLTKCPACSKSVSNEAATCIHCGHPISATGFEGLKKDVGGIRDAFWVILALFLFLGMCGAILGG